MSIMVNTKYGEIRNNTYVEFQQLHFPFFSFVLPSFSVPILLSNAILSKGNLSAVRVCVCVRERERERERETDRQTKRENNTTVYIQQNLTTSTMDILVGTF